MVLHIFYSYKTHPYQFSNWVCAALTLFFIPLMIGTIIAVLEDNDVIRCVFRKIGLRMLYLSPSAWDTQFKFLAKNNFVQVLVTLTDGRTVFGYFGNTSVASSDWNERDLYLQHIFRLNEQGKYVVDRRSGGILIKAASVATVEFVRDDIRIEDEQHERPEQ